MSWLRNLIGVVYTQVQVYRATVLPVVYVVGASLFTGLLGAWGEPIGFLPYILAVIVAAWLGGLYGGLLTTALSAGAITLGYSLAYQPAGQMGLQDFFLRLGLFAFMGGVASYLAMQCQRAVTAYDRLQKTLSNAREAWVFADVRGRVVFLNTLAQAWSGWHLAHARHRPLDQLFVLLHETTRKPIPIRLDEIVRQRHPVHLPEDAVLLTAGGSTIPVEGSIVPIQSNSDEVVEVLLMFREVSSARRAKKEAVRQEAMADQLAESVPGGLLLLEADGKCVRVNSEAARLFGRGKDELLGHGWMRGLSSQDQEAVLSAVEEACTRDHASVTTAELVSRTGTASVLRMRFRAGFGEAPSCQVVALVEDVSQAKALERSLDQVRAESAMQMQQLQEQIQRLQGERDELKSQLAEAKQKAEQEHQTLAKQMEQLRAEIAAKPAHQPDLQLALQQAKQDLASERAKRETAEKARQEAEKAVQELEKELEQAWQHRESLEQELKQLRSELEAFQKEIGQARDRVSAAEAECQEWRSRLVAVEEEHRRQIHELEKQLRETSERFQQREAERRQLEAQWSTRAAEWDAEKQSLEARVAHLNRDLEAARKRDHLLSSVLESAPIGLLAVTGAGQIAYCNPTARRLLHLPTEDAFAPERLLKWFVPEFSGKPYIQPSQGEDGQNHDGDAGPTAAPQPLVAHWVTWEDSGRILAVSLAPVEPEPPNREEKPWQPLLTQDAEWLSYN